MLFARYVGYVLLTAVLCACAAPVLTQPARMTPSTDTVATAPRLRVLATTIVKQDQGYRRRIPADSLWRRVGTLPQGDVYRPVNIVFTIEGRQVHEAYLVLQDASLSGFYLPGEFAFSPLSHPPTLVIRKEKND